VVLKNCVDHLQVISGCLCAACSSPSHGQLHHVARLCALQHEDMLKQVQQAGTQASYCATQVGAPAAFQQAFFLNVPRSGNGAQQLGSPDTNGAFKLDDVRFDVPRTPSNVGG
jgi:hypothetical protein